MIARISSGGFVGGAIGYNDDKVEEGLASVLEYANFDQCMEDGYKPADNCEIPGETLNNIDTQDVIHLIPDTAAFMMRLQLAKNSRVEKGVFSCSLNLNHDDLNNIDEKIKANGCKSEDELYRKIADKYMEGMGYGKQPYVVFKHNDIERTHIHIVSIKVDADGKKIDDRFAKRRSEQVRNDINVSFGLSTAGELQDRKHLSVKDKILIANSRNNYIFQAASRLNKAAQPEALVNGTSHLKHQISNVLKFVDENYHPKNLNEYNKVLAQFNVVCKPCTKGEDNQGKGYTGCQYAVLNGNGEVDSHLIKGSAFGKQYAMPALMAKFELNKGSEDIRKSDEISKKYIRETIDSFIKAPANVDFDSLAEHLNEKGIKVNKVADLDDPTKIKGINFIDNINGNTYNGSQLGKAYSYQNICGAIDKHNAEVDKQTEVSADKVYLPKEDFVRSQKVLQKAFDDIYKRERKYDSYIVPSKILKDLVLYNSTSSFTNDAVKLNKGFEKPLALSDAQWNKATDYFIKDKMRNLPEMEFKEQSYQRSQIISAVKFSQHIPSEQDRMDFLQRAGIHVKNEGRPKPELYFYSYARQDVSISLSELREATKEDAEPIKSDFKVFHNASALPTPNYDLPVLSHQERMFFNDYVKNDEKPIFKMEVSEVVNLLGKSEQQQMLDSVRVPSDMWKDTNNRFRELQNSIVKDDFHYSTAKFLDNFDNYKPQFERIASEVCGNNLMAEKMMRDYIEYLNTVVRQKEKEKSLNKIVSACKFVTDNVSGTIASELLLRMGVKVDRDADGRSQFSALDNPNAKFTKQDLVNKDVSLFGSNIPVTSAVDMQNFESGNLKPLSKTALDTINLIEQDKLSADNYNPSVRFTLEQYMDTDKFAQKVAPVDTQARLNAVLDFTKNKDIDAFVHGLFSHGLFLRIGQDYNGYSFRVYNTSTPDAMVSLPKSVADVLSSPHNVAVLKKQMAAIIPDDKPYSFKMGVIKDIVKAGENDSVDMLNKSIDKVRKSDPSLANLLVRYANQRDTQNNNRIDYDFLCRFVMNYDKRRSDYPIYHEITKPSNTFIKRPVQESLVTSMIKLLEPKSKPTINIKPVQWPKKLTHDFDGYAFELLKEKYDIVLTGLDMRNIGNFGMLPHLVKASINGEKIDVALKYDKKEKAYYLAPPSSFKIEDRHKSILGNDGIETLLKNGVIDVDNYKLDNGKISDITICLNAKTQTLYLSNEKINFVTKYKDYSQSNDQEESQNQRKGLRPS